MGLVGLDEAIPMKVLLLQNCITDTLEVSISMTVTGGLITVTNHELNGNAVMFTGSGTMPTGLFKIRRIMLVRSLQPPKHFQSVTTVNGLAIPLTSNNSGS